MRTAETTMEAVTSLLAALGRKAVVVGDALRFGTSRILCPMINDAARVVQAGMASTDAVDALMQGCLGFGTGISVGRVVAASTSTRRPTRRHCHDPVARTDAAER
ncbi:MAG: 3-hydroxyacyl-CoA dehydrogenase family protein [Pseudonocardiaceae bacterium]